MIIARENSLFVHQSSLTVLPLELSRSKAAGTEEGYDEFCLAKYLSYFEGLFNTP
jgi:hypothetical protein